MMGVATVPRVLPRILRMPSQADELHFVTLAGIMDLQASELFRGYQVLGSAPFRITPQQRAVRQRRRRRQFAGRNRGAGHQAAPS